MDRTNNSYPSPTRGWRFAALLSGGGLITGGLLGAGIVYQTVEPQTQVRTVTEMVSVTETPDACIEAIDLADTGLNLTASSLSLAMDGWEAYMNDDVAGIEMATAGMDQNNTEMDQIIDPYQQAKAACNNF